MAIPWGLLVPRPYTLKLLGVALVAFLYAASLFCTAFEFLGRGQQAYSGWYALTYVPRYGWVWGFDVQVHLILAWLPNVLLLVGVAGLLLGSRRTAFLASAFALLGGLYGPGYFSNRGDHTLILGAGYYLWVGSMGVLAGLSLLGLWRGVVPMSPRWEGPADKWRGGEEGATRQHVQAPSAGMTR